MERVAFLIEKTGERLGCLLNPESLTLRRTAGLERRQSTGGPLTAASQADDPLLYTGGGTTEMELDLLFDTSLAGSTVLAEDVRTLTRPLWDLAENSVDPDGGPEPPLVRFVWGKTWNVPGVVAAVAERLEFFTEGGVPRRSWLRMRLLRVQTPDSPRGGTQAKVTDINRIMTGVAADAVSKMPATETDRAVEVTGGSTDAAEETQSAPVLTRLDEIAYRYFGDANLWRLIAWFNNVSDPLHISVGKLLHIPPRPPAGGPS